MRFFGRYSHAESFMLVPTSTTANENWFRRLVVRQAHHERVDENTMSGPFGLSLSKGRWAAYFRSNDIEIKVTQY